MDASTWTMLFFFCLFNRLMLYILDKLFRSLKWNPVFRNWNCLWKIVMDGDWFYFFPLEWKEPQVIGVWSLWHLPWWAILYFSWTRKQVPGIKETDSLCVTTGKVSLNAVHSQTSVRIFFFFFTWFCVTQMFRSEINWGSITVQNYESNSQ